VHVAEGPKNVQLTDVVAERTGDGERLRELRGRVLAER
jgi:hypothetical protein